MSEVIRTYLVDCYGVTPNGQQALEKPVVVKIEDLPKKRNVFCPQLENGKCAARDTEGARPGCIRSVPEIMLFDNTHIPLRESISLSVRQREELIHLARGATIKDRADKGYNHQTIRNLRIDILSRLNAANGLDAILTGYENGIFTADEVIDVKKLHLVSQLTDSEKRLMDVMIQDNGRHSSRDELAQRTDLSPNTIKHYLLNVTHKLSVNNSRQAALYWRISQGPPHPSLEFGRREKTIELTAIQQKELLAMARGDTTEDSAKKHFKAAQTVKSQRTLLMRKFGTDNSVATVLTALNKGFLAIGEVVDEDKIPLISQLTVGQKRVLEALITNNGTRSSYDQIASDLIISRNTVRNHLAAVMERLDIRNSVQAALLYRAAKIMESIAEDENDVIIV